MQKISNHVYVETGEGVVMIETPMVPSESIKWRDEMAKYGPVRYVINNEPHYDHISGNCFFGGTLVTHEGTRDGILSSRVGELTDRLKVAAPENLPLPEGFRFRPPDITLSQHLTIYLGKHTFKLMHLPGHTPSQIGEKKLVTSCYSGGCHSGGVPVTSQHLSGRRRIWWNGEIS